jgi:hypothetical protein
MPGSAHDRWQYEFFFVKNTFKVDFLVQSRPQQSKAALQVQAASMEVRSRKRRLCMPCDCREVQCLGLAEAVNIHRRECCAPHVAHEPRHLLGKGEEEEREKNDIAHLDDLVYSVFYVTSQGGYNRAGKICNPERFHNILGTRTGSKRTF